MPTLLETKVAVGDLAAVRHRLHQAGAALVGSLDQRDVYFKVESGWLKLRKAGAEASLIAYYRVPRPAQKCQYSTTDIADPDIWQKLLAGLLGIVTVVTKRREEWSCGHSMIHLDRVVDLGDFVEIETSTENHAQAPLAHRELATVLGVDVTRHIGVAYADLLTQAQALPSRR